MTDLNQDQKEQPRVGLFVTCLADLFRPSVGFAAARLLEEAGCRVEAPLAQTCCGQPAYNSGDRASAKAIAAQVIDAFEGFDYVVAPSGSCAGMLRRHYPALFAGDEALEARAIEFAGRCWELVSFLHDLRGMRRVAARFDGAVAYHDACAGLRELGISEQPRSLLSSVAGLTLKELSAPETCCGFGGLFAVKYPDISIRMVSDKTKEIAETGAETLLGGDLGCLMNIAGRLSREGSPIQVRHVAEVLAGMADGPAIGPDIGPAVEEGDS
jgi:L-lactate dehydrogenase complex protein LldE